MEKSASTFNEFKKINELKFFKGKKKKEDDKPTEKEMIGNIVGGVRFALDDWWKGNIKDLEKDWKKSSKKVMQIVIHELDEPMNKEREAAIKKEIERMMATGSINLNESETLNEASKVIKRKYTDYHPEVRAGSKAPMRETILEFVKDNAGCTREELSDFIKSTNEDGQPGGNNTSMKWVGKNSRYFKESTTKGVKTFKLSKLGNRVVEKVHPEFKPLEEGVMSEIDSILKQSKSKENFIKDGYGLVKMKGKWSGKTSERKEIEDYLGGVYDKYQKSNEMDGDVTLIEEGRYNRDGKDSVLDTAWDEIIKTPLIGNKERKTLTKAFDSSNDSKKHEMIQQIKHNYCTDEFLTKLGYKLEENMNEAKEMPTWEIEFPKQHLGTMRKKQTIRVKAHNPEQALKKGAKAAGFGDYWMIAKRDKLTRLDEGLSTYGIEYKEKGSSKFKKASLTMTTHNQSAHKEMLKAIKKEANGLKKQDGWDEFRITLNSKPINESLNESANYDKADKDGKLKPLLALYKKYEKPNSTNSDKRFEIYKLLTTMGKTYKFDKSDWAKLGKTTGAGAAAFGPSKFESLNEATKDSTIDEIAKIVKDTKGGFFSLKDPIKKAGFKKVDYLGYRALVFAKKGKGYMVTSVDNLDNPKEAEVIVNKLAIGYSSIRESLNEEDVFVLWADSVTGNLTKAIKKAKYKGKGGKWSGDYKTNAKEGHGTVFFILADDVADAKDKVQNITDSHKDDENIYTLNEARDESGYTPKFKVDDVVANNKKKTIGIVRMADDSYGEVKTDADGNVDVDTVEKYDAKNSKHKKYKMAPSTKKEIESKSLNESIKKDWKDGELEKAKKNMAGYLGGDKMVKAATDDELKEIVRLKDEMAEIRNSKIVPLIDKLDKIYKKYKIKNPHKI